MPSSHEGDFRKHFETHYADSGVTFEQLTPSYEFGFQAASDPKFRGKKFHDIEADIKEAFLAQYPEQNWEQIWDALFFGWEKAGGTAGGWSIV